jgi:hypothetical protein
VFHNTARMRTDVSRINAAIAPASTTPVIRSRTAQLVVASGVVTLVAVLATPIAGETIGARFLAALRIAKPKTVTASVSIAGGTRPGRELQNVISGILAETAAVAFDEPDALVPAVDSASRAAGFPARLATRRTDTATVEVLGAHRVTLRVNRNQLQTLFAEAGRAGSLPPSLDGASVTLMRPRGVRVRYGTCPSPIANTLQSQIQGPPPPTDNASCIILTEVPLAAVTVPPTLDTATVMEIALELSGMSPNQARDFRSLFDWPSALALSPPRATRSHQIVDLGGGRGMLMAGGGRRDPLYTLVWARNGVVYTLAGYGNSGDAVPLAESVR